MILKKLCYALLILTLTVSAFAYKVEKGDSLYKIAREHGTTPAKLAELNGIDENAVLQVGQNIKVSADGSAPIAKSDTKINKTVSASLGSTYTVKSGDTIYGIAQKTGLSVSALMSANGFNNDTVIKAGQTIKLPDGSGYSKPNVKFAHKIEPGRTDAASLAVSLVGTRYVSGGTSRGGFDCSGLVNYIYGQLGITVPRTARELAVCGTAVDRSNLQKGDILLFSIHRSGIDHVGIYVGGGQFVHAASTKKGVIKSSLSNDYNSAHYVGARRVF